jgi:hypothetical protein
MCEIDCYQNKSQANSVSLLTIVHIIELFLYLLSLSGVLWDVVADVVCKYYNYIYLYTSSMVDCHQRVFLLYSRYTRWYLYAVCIFMFFMRQTKAKFKKFQNQIHSTDTKHNINGEASCLYFYVCVIRKERNISEAPNMLPGYDIIFLWGKNYKNEEKNTTFI